MSRKHSIKKLREDEVRVNEPLSDVLQRRKEKYLSRFKAALDEVYSSDNLGLISLGESSLEVMLAGAELASKTAVLKRDSPRKQRIDRAEYFELRKSGLTPSEIYKEYEGPKKNSIFGWERWYSQRRGRTKK